MRRSSYCRSLSVAINDITGNKRHSPQINIIKKKITLFLAPLHFDMISQVSKSDLNINASRDKCACTQRGVDYYKILSLELNCNDTEVKDA